MTRRYLSFALLSFLAYSLVAPLLKIAVATLPSTPVVFLSNFVLFVLVGAFMVWRGESPVPYVRHRYAPLIVLSGILLTVGLLTYYRALALGPVSVVVPIFGLFLVGSSAIGVALFGEALTARKGLAIATAVASVYLVSTG